MLISLNKCQLDWTLQQLNQDCKELKSSFEYIRKYSGIFIYCIVPMPAFFGLRKCHALPWEKRTENI